MLKTTDTLNYMQRENRVTACDNHTLQWLNKVDVMFLSMHECMKY